MPTATATDLGQAEPSARTAARSVPARVPSGTNVCPSFSPGGSKPGYAASKYSLEGRPSVSDHIALYPAVQLWRRSTPVSHQTIQSVASMNAYASS